MTHVDNFIEPRKKKLKKYFYNKYIRRIGLAAIPVTDAIAMTRKPLAALTARSFPLGPSSHVALIL